MKDLRSPKTEEVEKSTKKAEPMRTGAMHKALRYFPTRTPPTCLRLFVIHRLDETQRLIRRQFMVFGGLRELSRTAWSRWCGSITATPFPPNKSCKQRRSRVCTDVKVLRKDKTDTLVPTFSELISAVAVATPLADGDEDGKEWMVVLRLYQMVNPNASVQLYDFTSSFLEATEEKKLKRNDREETVDAPNEKLTVRNFEEDGDRLFKRIPESFAIQTNLDILKVIKVAQYAGGGKRRFDVSKN
ncbi:hypothetical protein RUM44_009332 [Polyplax serrata]|uniref:Uncharacterized protein n=1 Tax=Polyplax serrata TaxID=468196 RepID=A0ABR1ASE5_POLSC